VRPFQINENRTETASGWEKWLRNIERQFRYFGITDPEMKKDCLIIYGGQIIADLEDTLLDATGDEAGEDAYAQLIIKLNKHFLPKKNKDFARFQFGNLKQNHGESLVRYYTRIREIAKKCSFSNESEAIRDHLIKTMTNNVVRIKAIRKNWTLDQILEEAELDEETRTQAKEMEKKVNSDETIKRVQNYRRQRQRPSSQIIREQSTSPTREKTINPCNRCGYDRAHKQCPAMGSLCNACGKRNHYAKVCRSKPAERFSNGRRQRQFEGKDARDTQQSTSGERNRIDRKMSETKNVKHVTYNRDRSPSTESSTSSDSDLVNHLKIHRTGDETTLSCVVYINGHKTLVEPDTGADSNIMDEIQLQELKTKSPELQLYESKVKLNTLKEKLPVKGECIVTIENETRIAQAPMVIIKGKINSLPSLGRTTLEELGMVKIDETGRLKEPNKPSSTCNIRKLQETQSSVDELLKPYQDLFHGIGRATRNGEEIQLHLPMDEEAEPVAQKPRRVAYHLMEPLQKRLQEFVEQDIMEKVPDQEPITWCSPMVVQPKPKNPNDIRLSLDLRTLKKSMLRTRQVQAPITDAMGKLPIQTSCVRGSQQSRPI
jgi:Arc/MetJ-type ribon-helix-helix transcriptional regulator